MPFPSYPVAQSQMKLPSVLVQLPFKLQLWVCLSHSLISKQSTPLPTYPTRHSQRKAPWLSWHLGGFYLKSCAFIGQWPEQRDHNQKRLSFNRHVKRTQRQRDNSTCNSSKIFPVHLYDTRVRDLGIHLYWDKSFHLHKIHQHIHKYNFHQCFCMWHMNHMHFQAFHWKSHFQVVCWQIYHSFISLQPYKPRPLPS